MILKMMKYRGVIKMKKRCYKCNQEYDTSNFYKNKKGKDGLESWCKSCCIERVHKYRENNIDKILLHDRERGRTEKRKEANKKRLLELKEINPEEYKKKEYLRTLKDRQKHHRNNIYLQVKRAINNGTIIKQELCEICKTNKAGHAHHEDYNKPLQVVWLCTKCHGIIHRKEDK